MSREKGERIRELKKHRSIEVQNYRSSEGHKEIRLRSASPRQGIIE